MKIINLFNQYHLGDHVFNINFLNKFSNEDIIFSYYANSIYFNELSNFITNKNINLFPIQHGNLPSDSYNMWINHNNYYLNVLHTYNYCYDLFYVDYFKKVCNDFNLTIPFIDKYDLLFDNKNYKVSLERNYDYLIINSVPLSDEFPYKETDFINLCDILTEKRKTFITTKKLKNYECTLDYNMSLLDIGNLSNYCSNIVAVNTSPIIPTFTKQNINTVQYRFVLSKHLTYSYNDRIIACKTFEPIYNYL